MNTLTITAPIIQSDALELLFENLGISMSSWHEAETPTCRFEYFCETSDEADELCAKIQKELGAIDPEGIVSISIEPLEEKDWQESWKDFFNTERVSERIVIKPTWETYSPRPSDCVIEIDPGMSFGTGQHATTRACLAFIDQISPEHPGATFLDLGCGSGILSIAAAKLGLSRITAFDIDPTAIEIAKQNAVLNGVKEEIHSAVQNVENLIIDPPFEITVANILAPVLLENSTSIAATVLSSPDARLILAGILTTQYENVRSCYEAIGFAEIRHITEEEWTTGLFRRNL